MDKERAKALIVLSTTAPYLNRREMREYDKLVKNHRREMCRLKRELLGLSPDDFVEVQRQRL